MEANWPVEKGVIPAIVLALAIEEPRPIKIGLVPFGEVRTSQIQAAKEGIAREYRAEVVVLKSQELPTVAYYKPRNRYRAERLLDDLDGRVRGFDRMLGITQSDISTTHRGHYDWGVVGLGTLGGPSCVVSTFRLKKKGSLAPLERLRRSVTHELGHTLGLEHCATPGCVMRDAEGKLKTMDEAGPRLCARCRRRAEPSRALR